MIQAAAIPLKRRGTERYAFSFWAMGTDCQVDFSSASATFAGEFQQEVLHWVSSFESRYSRFLPDSLISEINRASGERWVETDAELEQLLDLCDWFYWDTDGLFDPTTLPLSRCWDYQSEHPRVPEPAEVEAARSRVGWSRVQRAPGRIFLPVKGMEIDLGGIGKEYAVDRVFEKAVDRGIEHVLVNFGSDLRAAGQAPDGKPWSIGLEHPRHPDHCWGGVRIERQAVVTSGTYRRRFIVDGRSYSHLIHPHTGYPVGQGNEAVTVIAQTCTEAGIRATTACLLGGEDAVDLLQKAPHIEGCVWWGDYQYETGGFRNYVQ